MHEIRYTQWRRQAGGTGARALWSLRTHANFADLTQDGFHFWMNLSPQTSKHVRHEPVPPPRSKILATPLDIIRNYKRNIHTVTCNFLLCISTLDSVLSSQLAEFILLSVCLCVCLDVNHSVDLCAVLVADNCRVIGSSTRQLKMFVM